MESIFKGDQLMIMKKWLLMTGTALSLSMLGACAQTEDEPVEEPNQEETEQSDETTEEDSTDEEKWTVRREQ